MADLIAPEPVALGPNEAVPGRPFTAPDLVERDLAVLGQLLLDLRTLVEDAVAGVRAIIRYGPLEWTVEGRLHRHIVCTEERLRSHPGLCVVGFFGERQVDLDSTPLEEANSALVAEFRNYPGITSYSSLELPSSQWANLVLHDDPVDRDYWRRSELHAEAVRALSPVHYRSVRIHNARLTAPVPENPSIVPTVTRYFDFSGGSYWQGLRSFTN
jgi:hypothetical protein